MQSPSPAEGELNLLERLATILTSLGEPRPVLEQLTDLFLGALQAERGLLLSFDAAGLATPLVVRNLSSETAEDMRATWSRRAVEQMAGAGHVIVSDDVLADRRFRDSESVVAQRIRSLLCVPLRVSGQLRGAVYVDHRRESRRFRDRDVAFARALAELASVILERTEAIRALHDENDSLRRQARRFQFGELIGASRAMQKLFERLQKVTHAPTDACLLLVGEHGTGKTQIARVLHRLGPRRDGPFVSFSAGSVPETLVESELFGHRRGSFTGAHADRPGLVDRAKGGTLFLDDVNSVPLPVQVKLLTLLQDREHRPIGGSLSRADLCIVGATSADLEREVREGRFRKDLYHRLNGIPIQVPPLRERQEDIPLLAQHFLAHYAPAVAKEVRGFTAAALANLVAYRWPGNVRELVSEIVHAVTMTAGPLVEPGDFKAPELVEARQVADSPSAARLNLERALQDTTEHVVRSALELHGGKVAPAARALGVSRGKMYDLMRRSGVAAAAGETRARRSPRRGRVGRTPP